MLLLLSIDPAAEGPPAWLLNIAFPALCGLVALLARFSYATKEKALQAEIETAKSEAARAHTRISISDQENAKRFEQATAKAHEMELEIRENRVKDAMREQMREREITREIIVDRMDLQDRVLEAIGKRTGSISSMEAVRAQLPRRDERRDSSEPPPSPTSRRPALPSRPSR